MISSISAPSGMSTAGIRHVTGSDEPAQNPNFISFDVSTDFFGPFEAANSNVCR